MGFGKILGSVFKFASSGWFKAVVTLAVDTVKLFTGKDVPTVTEILPQIAGNIFTKLQHAIDFEGLDTKEKIDSWLDEIDCQTGDDPGALDIMPDLSPQQEEAFFDHQIAAVRIWAYARAGLNAEPGLETGAATG